MKQKTQKSRLSKKEFWYLLEKSGKSQTREREIVFEQIRRAHHFSAEEIFAQLKKAEKISRMSVFRIVGLFAEIGIIRKIGQTESKAALYELQNPGDHHEHIECAKCHRVVEFCDEPIHKKLENLARDAGFVLESHELKLIGICQKCQRKSK